MCNPIALGVASLATTIAGGVLSAKGAADKAASDQDYYNHLADVAKKNIPEVQAQAEYERGAISETASRETQANKVQTKQLMSTQKVAAAANNIGGSITEFDIARDTLNKSTLDEMYIRYNADVQKYMSRKKEAVDVKNLREQAAGYRKGGESARNAGNMQVAGSLLSTAGQVANSFYNYNRKVSGE